MEENFHDCNNSMDEEKENEKAIEEANNTMIEKNKENQIKNKKKKSLPHITSCHRRVNLKFLVLLTTIIILR